MDYLESKQEARAEFIELVRANPTLAPMADSQLFAALNIFQNLALEVAMRRVERARQENYLSSALNRSSVLALAEDRLYVPRKRVPAFGPVRIRNTNAEQAGIPALVKLLSEEQVPYTLTDAAVIPPGETITVTAHQMEHGEAIFTVSEEKPFYEVLLDRELSPMVCEMAVYIDLGDGYRECEKHVMFRNAGVNDYVYDEFLTHTEQIGVRFGNGIFGAILPQNTQVRVLYWLSHGQIDLLAGQELTPVGEIPSGLTFSVAETITGGRPGESIKEIGTNAKYSVLYDESVIWNDDFSYYVKRHFPDLLWFKCWGEQEMEAMTGEMRLEYINRIYFSAYSPDNPTIHDDLLVKLKEVPRLNRTYHIFPREDHSFVVSITGRLAPEVPHNEAVEKIRAALTRDYGKDSYTRRSGCYLKDLYHALNALEIFTSQMDYSVAVTGQHTPEKLYQMCFIDIDASMKALSLTYADH